MRTLYLAIVPAILMLLLVACGSSPTATSQPQATAEQPSEPTQQASEPTEEAIEPTQQAIEPTEQPSVPTEQATETTDQATGASDQVFTMQFVCINRSLQTCDLFTEYVARVEERSNGQLKLDITSLPELGISGTDMLDLLEDGTVEFTELPGNFVGGDLALH